MITVNYYVQFIPSGHKLIHEPRWTVIFRMKSINIYQNWSLSVPCIKKVLAFCSELLFLPETMKQTNKQTEAWIFWWRMPCAGTVLLLRAICWHAYQSHCSVSARNFNNSIFSSCFIYFIWTVSGWIFIPCLWCSPPSRAQSLQDKWRLHKTSMNIVTCQSVMLNITLFLKSIKSMWNGFASLTLGARKF